MTTYTREHLEQKISMKVWECDLAAFTLALLDENEALRRDKIQLGEERAAEWKRAEKAEAERDDANDERDDAIDRWARRAREAEATVKDYLTVQAERDRLLEENKSLREANEIDLGEKAPLIFENAQLKARNEILREELRDAEEAVLFADAYIRSELADDYRIVEGDNRVWCKDFTAVRRARKRTRNQQRKGG